VETFGAGILVGLNLALGGLCALLWAERRALAAAAERERAALLARAAGVQLASPEPDAAARRSYGCDDDEWAVETRRRGVAGLPALPEEGE
jgi:hypothetical protein